MGAVAFSQRSEIFARTVATHGGRVRIVLKAVDSRSTFGTASQLVAGDRLERTYDLANTGNAGISSVSLTTAARPPSLLATSRRQGLQLAIDRCSVRWHAGTHGFTCPGSLAHVLSRRPVLGTDLQLAGLHNLSAPRAVAHLRIRLMLPASAPQELEGLSSRLTYRFTAVQGAASKNELG